MNKMMKRFVVLIVLALMPVLMYAQFRSGAAYEELDDSETVAAPFAVMLYVAE